MDVFGTHKQDCPVFRRLKTTLVFDVVGSIKRLVICSHCR